MRAFIEKILYVICAVFILCLVSMVWDYNEKAYDAKMESQLIWDYIRIYEEGHDPDAIIYPYVGSTKTKVFHKFESKCAKEIRSTHLTGFNSKDDAVKAGYSRCSACKP